MSQVGFAVDVDDDGEVDHRSDWSTLQVGDRVNYCFIGADFVVVCHDYFGRCLVALTPVP